MRRLVREALDATTADSLTRRQADADRKQDAGTLDVDRTWKNARQASDLKEVLTVLRRMAGSRERCMYCADSHGTDIEHFWPKTPYPECMFRWANLLLCCAECGRLKGSSFPLDGSAPLLIDPTNDSPWDFLDFDPTTGIVMARYDAVADRQSPKGAATVLVLHLNQREAMNEGCRKTYRRLCAAVEGALSSGAVDPAGLLSELLEQDDHGILGWCFSKRGQTEAPFRQLYEQQRQAWEHCAVSVDPA